MARLDCLRENIMTQKERKELKKLLTSTRKKANFYSKEAQFSRSCSRACTYSAKSEAFRFVAEQLASFLSK